MMGRTNDPLGEGFAIFHELLHRLFHQSHLPVELVELGIGGLWVQSNVGVIRQNDTIWVGRRERSSCQG